MAKSCAGCGFYDATGEVADCPTCNRGLQTTFLPPPGADAGPAVKWGPPLAGPRSARQGSGFDGIGFLVRNRVLLGIVVAPVLLCLKLAFGVGPGRGSGDIGARYDKVQIGMTSAQVDKILFGNTPFGKSTHNFSQTGFATMSYQSDGSKIAVYFTNGRVSGKTLTGDDEDEEGDVP